MNYRSILKHFNSQCSLQVLERVGPGPIGSKKWGPRVNFKGGDYSLT